MKKCLFFSVLVALLALPWAAQAAAPAATTGGWEFTLGGYIKMETIWDSTQVNKNLLGFIARNNHADFQHGRLKFTAENTRMSFTIKGPKLWGATVTGYIEWDFDNHANEYIMTGTPGGGWASPHKARIGLRHAFFRLNWPETELLLGQYWSLLTEEVPETANFGACTTAGQPFLREPQIRLTHMFALGPGKMTASIALAEPTNGLWGLALNANQAGTNPYSAESAEIPKIVGRIKYDADLWGKAAFWGAPRPFSMRVGATWWQERFRNTPAVTAGRQFGLNNQAAVDNFLARNYFVTHQQYMNHWLVEASVFIPVIPTTTKNLAGTASILTQWWIGAGLDGYFEDFPATSSYLTLDYRYTYLVDACRRDLMRRWGGFVQAQYYFTNEWFMNVVYGMNRAFGVNLRNWRGDTAANDPVKLNQHVYGTLWYQPIKALKFGLEYTYVRTQYFQKVRVGSVGTDVGENHRVMFCGFFFF